MIPFTVTPLEEDHLAAAYPLIRTVAPVAPERWEVFARDRMREGGILGLYAGATTLLGLAVWRREDCLRHGAALRADALVTFELDRLAPARSALCAALERLADEFGCASVVVTVPARGYAASGAGKAERWRELGFAPDTVTFVKPVAAEAGGRAAREA